MRRARAERRLATATTDAERAAIRRDAINEARGAVATASAVSAPALDARSRARMQGYEGDNCGECGNFTLVRNGTCMKCNTCGGTSGCCCQRSERTRHRR